MHISPSQNLLASEVELVVGGGLFDMCRPSDEIKHSVPPSCAPFPVSGVRLGPSIPLRPSIGPAIFEMSSKPL